MRDGGHGVTIFCPERRGGHLLGKLREGAAAIWATNVAKKVQDLIWETRPDVIHCHNLFPGLSPATLRVADRAGVAVVLTLHNYRLLCLPATFLRDGQICEDCLGRQPWRGVVHRCYRNSAAGSAALAMSLAVHRIGRTFDRVDLYLAVSDFVRIKHLQAGFSPARMLTKPNFAWASSRREGAGEYFLIAGRLSAEKDVRTILDAWRSVRARLVIVGDGPDTEMLRRAAPQSVEFRGTVPPGEVSALLGRARALLFPSLSYEGAPRAVLEAYAAGVPVVANAVGALPEIVIDGVTGLLVPPGDPTAVTDALEHLMDDAESCRLGEGAWTAWHDHYEPGRALLAIEDAYRLALANRGTR